MYQGETKRILVTGATGFLGYRVVVALLSLGVEVTVLVRPDRQEQLATLQEHIRVVYADVWNRASLKGRARGQQAIIHLVGSTHADPKRGLTYNQVNLVPTRHVTAMAVSDGVPHMILLSSVVRPFDLPSAYILSKRDSEDYLINSGLSWTVVRAPALYAPNSGIMLRLLAVIGATFPFSLLLGRHMPLSADIAARGLAGISLAPQLYMNRIVYAGQLRRMARQLRQSRSFIPNFSLRDRDTEGLEEAPFGWLPPYS